MSDEILAMLNDQNRTLGSIEAKLEMLCGNGQPGLIKEMRDDIDNLKSAKNWMWGLGSGIMVVEGAFHYILHKAGLK